MKDVNLHLWAREAIKGGVIERLEKAIVSTSDPFMKALHLEQIKQIRQLASAS
jgi:hypothetical protein